MVAVIYVAEPGNRNAVVALAREFSPRIDVCGTHEVALDASGLHRLFGDAPTLGHELGRTAVDRGLRVRIAIAGTCTAARLLVHHRAGLTIVEPGTEAAVLAPLPLRLLQVFEAIPGESARGGSSHGKAEPGNVDQGVERGGATTLVTTLRRWGLRTLGELAALPPSALTARLGQAGVRWQRLARGEDPRPLVPALHEEPFEQSIDLEWPIEGLEPLSFVLGRLMEPLAAELERRDRGAAVLRVSLHLVTRDVHARSIELPSAIRDARTLRTLALLDLESHPPSAAIDRVVVAVDPTPARVLQFSLLTRPIPAPEVLSTLVARLTAVMGEGRCGSPAIVDSWAPGAFAVVPFAPAEATPLQNESPREPGVALRRFRYPVVARVRTEGGRPVHILAGHRSASGGAVVMSAGPWRTSGGWWHDQPPTTHHPAPSSWDRDEWEVTLGDGVSYRLFRERDRDGWFIDAVID
jgi:protein ImuB